MADSSIEQSTKDILGALDETINTEVCDICDDNPSNTAACTQCQDLRIRRAVYPEGTSGNALERAKYMLQKKITNISEGSMFTKKEDLRLSQAQRNSYKSQIKALNTLVKALFTKGILPLAVGTPLDANKKSDFANVILTPYYKATQNIEEDIKSYIKKFRKYNKKDNEIKVNDEDRTKKEYDQSIRSNFEVFNLILSMTRIIYKKLVSIDETSTQKRIVTRNSDAIKTLSEEVNTILTKEFANISSAVEFDLPDEYVFPSTTDAADKEYLIKVNDRVNKWFQPRADNSQAPDDVTAYNKRKNIKEVYQSIDRSIVTGLEDNDLENNLRNLENQYVGQFVDPVEKYIASLTKTEAKRHYTKQVLENSFKYSIILHMTIEKADDYLSEHKNNAVVGRLVNNLKTKYESRLRAIKKNILNLLYPGQLYGTTQEGKDYSTIQGRLMGEYLKSSMNAANDATAWPPLEAPGTPTMGISTRRLMGTPGAAAQGTPGAALSPVPVPVPAVAQGGPVARGGPLDAAASQAQQQRERNAAAAAAAARLQDDEARAEETARLAAEAAGIAAIRVAEEEAAKEDATAKTVFDAVNAIPRMPREIIVAAQEALTRVGRDGDANAVRDAVIAAVPEIEGGRRTRKLRKQRNRTHKKMAKRTNRSTRKH